MGLCLSAVLNLFGSGGGITRPLGGSKRLIVGQTEYKVVRTVGEGGYSFVHLCRDPVDREVAVKQTIVQGDEENGEDVQKVLAECEFLRDLPRHPNIVRYMGHSAKPRGESGKREVLLAMELCTGSLLGTMQEHVRAGTLFSIPRVLGIFAEVLAGVAHLHSQSPPITHRDLKAENVLLGADGRWKLCDLGSATRLCFVPKTRQEICVAEEEIEQNTTLMCRAPEQVDLWQKKRLGPPVDVWALGVLLFYATFLEPPFEAQPLQILNCKYDFPRGAAERVGEGILSLIRKLLTTDPAERPDVWDVSIDLAGILPEHSAIPRTRPRGPSPR